MFAKQSVIEYEKDGKEAGADETGIPEYLRQARELAGNGIRELRCSINHPRPSSSYGLITQGLYQPAQSAQAFEVAAELHGEDRKAYSHLSPDVYESPLEGCTTSL